MNVNVKFFARFRELLGTDIVTEAREGMTIAAVVSAAAKKNREGHDAIFDQGGNFLEFVIVMQNGQRVETADAAAIPVADGDVIAIFPPVAGG
jgi:molybdopterin synthase sulfur carrier subunit